MKSKKDYDLARRTVDETARRNRITARAIVSQRPPIRQIELIDTSVAIAISLFGGVAAPSIISFISEVASRLRRRYHSITICTELAEVIGREVVTRFAEPRATVRLMSLAELAKGKGFKLLFRQRDKTYTVRLNQHGELESCIRR